MATLTQFGNILQVAFGLGFVIFLHELGHFLLAKWNGVKVEKFSIGFGPTLWGFRRGETEYVLAAIPLGGFVKMLGEGPDDEANKSSDPRAFPNKSVGARMAIISAGVIMNLILGLACFVYYYGHGTDEVPAILGGVMAGSPAYEAGLRPGDEIVAVDGRRGISFNSMTVKVLLSGDGQKVHFDIKRPGRDDVFPLDIEPRREESTEVPRIGVSKSSDLKLGKPPFPIPAGMAPPPKEQFARLKLNDRLIEAGPEGQDHRPVADFEDLRRLLARDRAKALTMVFERKSADAKGGTPGTERIEVTLPPNHFLDFGARMTIEPIATIQAGSPAEKAGFRVGDLITKVEGTGDFDPMRLADLCYDHAGRPMTFEVERHGADKSVKTETLEVTPDDTPAWSEIVFPNEPQEIPGLGLAYPVRTRIAAIAPGSPAAKAGLKVHDVIDTMTFPPDPSDKAAKPLEVVFHDKQDRSRGWPSAFAMLQFAPKPTVKITVNGSKKAIAIAPEPDPDWPQPLRGLTFQELSRRLPPQDIAAALRRGFDDTIENIVGIYAMLRSLAQKRVSPKLLGGPVMIAEVAYSSAASGINDLVHFLGILSINLAVLNFLPVPPLDGGQMVFLVAEKVRGRPLPDSALIAVSWIGIFLLLCVMGFVMYQDIYRHVAG